MSETVAPGGLSTKEFKLFTVEVGQWMLGVVKGSWNEKMSVSQIIADAVIGMIPVVGDVTAARDLIAVATGLATDEEKRSHTMEWVLLVIFIFALIPVFGGVIKGVGRIALRATEIALEDAVAAAKIAEEVVAFLNRIGHKNAQLWLKTLDLIKYESVILEKFRTFCDVIILAIGRFVLCSHLLLPQSFIARLEALSAGFTKIKALGESKIPESLKQLHETLERLQKFIHSGGAPASSRAATMTAQTGQKTVSYVEEARAIESGAAKKIVRAGKYKQNLAGVDKLSDIRKVYQRQPGYPDLMSRIETATVGGTEIKYYPLIAAAHGPIKNEMIEGQTLFRSFGPKGETHGVPVGASNPIGQCWGIGRPPRTAKEWREYYAVLDEWNRNGWISMVHIPAGVKVPACTSTVSEQFSKKIAGQYLEGGGKQAVIEAFFEKDIMDAANALYARGGGKITLPNGIVVEIRQSGWSGINKKVGYGAMVIPAASMTERLGVTEFQTKVKEESVKQGVIAGADKQKEDAEKRRSKGS
jgi:hypothetical protein